MKTQWNNVRSLLYSKMATSHYFIVMPYAVNFTLFQPKPH